MKKYLTMSKKYFTKYLPVEGEIKGGDKAGYYGTDKLHPPIGTIVDIVDDIHGSIMEDKLWKKVKLFLCSRDIQVGDKLITQTGKVDIPVTGISYLELPTLQELVNKERLFKVIGKISKDASWVKEDDEFNEEDINHWCGGNSDGLTMLCSMCRGVSDWKDCKKHIIKIKGTNGFY